MIVGCGRIARSTLGESVKVRIAYCVFRIPSSRRHGIRNAEYEISFLRQPGREAFSSVSARGGPLSDCYENRSHAKPLRRKGKRSKEFLAVFASLRELFIRIGAGWPAVGLL